jgi:hypothetical protein
MNKFAVLEEFFLKGLKWLNFMTNMNRKTFLKDGPLLQKLALKLNLRRVFNITMFCFLRNVLKILVGFEGVETVFSFFLKHCHSLNMRMPSVLWEKIPLSGFGKTHLRFPAARLFK